MLQSNGQSSCKNKNLEIPNVVATIPRRIETVWSLQFQGYPQLHSEIPCPVKLKWIPYLHVWAVEIDRDFFSRRFKATSLVFIHWFREPVPKNSFMIGREYLSDFAPPITPSIILMQQLDAFFYPFPPSSDPPGSALEGLILPCFSILMVKALLRSFWDGRTEGPKSYRSRRSCQIGHEYGIVLTYLNNGWWTLLRRNDKERCVAFQKLFQEKALNAYESLWRIVYLADNVMFSVNQDTKCIHMDDWPGRCLSSSALKVFFEHFVLP